jgi:hypothetical protein
VCETEDISVYREREIEREMSGVKLEWREPTASTHLYIYTSIHLYIFTSIHLDDVCETKDISSQREREREIDR